LASRVLALALLLLAPSAAAEEWHEAYRAGVLALEKGDAARAAAAFERAIARRPEPGRNVRTYGTNFEPRYFPYLRLAEARLALGQADAAQKALEASAKWGDREPAEERQRLAQRLEAAVPPKPAPPTTTLAPAATAPPVTAPAPPTTLGAASDETPPPTLAPTTTVAAATSGSRKAPPAITTPALPPGSAPESVPSAAAAETTGAVEVVSDPAGASVYVDDELLGTTDPRTGRLVKSGLSAGRHRVRVSLAGRGELARDVDVAAGGQVLVEAALAATTPAAPAEGLGGAAGIAAFALVALALVAVIAWSLRKDPGPEAAAAEAARAHTPTGQLSPGASRDSAGQDWFGDYRVLELLGRGGMASVFKAERRGELVALKRPLAAFLGDPEFLERFSREAEIGRTLNHPNIVRILERGEHEGVPYFTMELVPGETLREVVLRGPADPRQAAAIVAQVAEALDFAHSKGVVHRDLKPSNVMLPPGGGVRVMDFGIARARRFEGITATAAFLGTPDYLAPEMIEGQGSDARSDLYALGVVLFELLAGRRPFVADTPYAVLRQHCTQPPPVLASLRPEVPGELSALVERLLEKDPERRPASAEELVIALRDWLNRAA
jgi:hypothetical protein